MFASYKAILYYVKNPLRIINIRSQPKSEKNLSAESPFIIIFKAFVIPLILPNLSQLRKTEARDVNAVNYRKGVLINLLSLDQELCNNTRLK
jgi:hypothetical protein